MKLGVTSPPSPFQLTIVGTALACLVRWLEHTMVGHIVIGFPLLISFGFYIGRRNANVFCRFATGGIPAILLATFTLAFWMIPRWVDASVTSLGVALIKYLCLIFFVGFMLGGSWAHLHFITKAVIKIEFLTMLFRLGWLYLVSPERLCNNYLLAEQLVLGKLFLAIGLLLTLLFCLPAFCPDLLKKQPADRNSLQSAGVSDKSNW